MVDFDTNARLLKAEGISVFGVSVDSVEQTKSLHEGLRLGYVQMFGGVDAEAVAESTGADIQTGDRTFLHATGFLLNSKGAVMQSVYASGPIGRLVANDVLKVVAFVKAQRSS